MAGRIAFIATGVVKKKNVKPPRRSDESADQTRPTPAVAPGSATGVVGACPGYGPAGNPPVSKVTRKARPGPAGDFGIGLATGSVPLMQQRPPDR